MGRGKLVRVASLVEIGVQALQPSVICESERQQLTSTIPSSLSLVQDSRSSDGCTERSAKRAPYGRCESHHRTPPAAHTVVQYNQDVSSYSYTYRWGSYTRFSGPKSFVYSEWNTANWQQRGNHLALRWRIRHPQRALPFPTQPQARSAI